MFAVIMPIVLALLHILGPAGVRFIEAINREMTDAEKAEALAGQDAALNRLKAALRQE